MFTIPAYSNSFSEPVDKYRICVNCKIFCKLSSPTRTVSQQGGNNKTRVLGNSSSIFMFSLGSQGIKRVHSEKGGISSQHLCTHLRKISKFNQCNIDSPHSNDSIKIQGNPLSTLSPHHPGTDLETNPSPSPSPPSLSNPSTSLLTTPKTHSKHLSSPHSGSENQTLCPPPSPPPIISPCSLT